MHYLTPVFATLTPEKDDVIRLNAMVEDYATALNRKDILHVRLKAITGDDNVKVSDWLTICETAISHISLKTCSVLLKHVLGLAKVHL